MGGALKFEDTLRLLNKNIKVAELQLLGILAIVGLIFMARSGNTSDVKPATFELLMRNFVRQHFIARPRTKSIFLGFPVVILFITLAKQRRLESLYQYFAIAIAIGQSNTIQNTFSHIRTPLYLSIGRVSGRSCSICRDRWNFCMDVCKEFNIQSPKETKKSENQYV